MSTAQVPPTRLAAGAHLDPRRAHTVAVLRRMVLGAIVLVLVQAGLGMATNLYVKIPSHHSGAHPSNYLSGSFHSVTWAIAHGPVTLAIHASFGLALVLMTISVVVASFKVRRSVGIWSLLGAGLVIGAGFNGASFLDFNNNISSLIMALLAFGSVFSYSVVLYLLGSFALGPRRHPESAPELPKRTWMA